MKKGRRSYQKPQIKEVKLIPEDAVLQNCKSSVGATKTASRCASSANCDNRIVGS
jgi:hypothetical protein